MSTVCIGIDLVLEELSRNSTETTTIMNGAVLILQDMKLSSSLTMDTVNDLLAFKKMQSNKMELDISQENFVNFAKESLKPLYLQALESNISIKLIENYDDDIFIMIDSTKIKTVIRNFISNALKFSSKGQQITVEISIQQNFSKIPLKPSFNEQVLRFNVIDNGPGISKVSQLNIC